MTSPLQLPPDAESAFLQHGQPATRFTGAEGQYIVMTVEAYESLLGLADSDAETIASIEAGLADFAAGRVKSVAGVFDRLEAKYEG